MEINIVNEKFCKHCGRKINKDAVLCIHCGLQVEALESNVPSVVINNTNENNACQETIVDVGVASEMVSNIRQVKKWTAFLLCLFLGVFGAHKFYEGKILLGILYFFTAGLFGLGWVIDTIIILFKPNPYCV